MARRGLPKGFKYPDQQLYASDGAGPFKTPQAVAGYERLKKLHSGAGAASSETTGGIDETKQKKEAAPEKPKARDDDIGTVSEVATPKEKEEEPEEPERKIATTITDDGIKCTIFLSLQTLALFRIAATTQAQIDEEEELSLGDFLDTCAEDFFRVRGKKLGLINSGGGKP